MAKKSTVNRLPKEERTHPTSKIIVRPREQMADPMEVDESLPHQPTRAHRPLPTLDNESLNRILQLAGPATMLRARGVNQQWCRVATGTLGKIGSVDLSHLFPNVPTSAIVHSTLDMFSQVTSIAIRDWPYCLVYPCIVDELTVADLPCLRKIELLGVYLTPIAIGLLVQRESVRCLTLGNHDSVNRAAVAAMRKAKDSLYRAGNDNGTTHLLDRLVFKRARCLTGQEISSVSRHNIAQEVVVTACPSVRGTRISCTSNSTSPGRKIYETYSLTNCRNLTSVTVNITLASKDCTYLNFSQCTRLDHIEFAVEDAESHGMDTALASDLRELNLAACRELRDIGMDQNEQVAITFPKLERLILFGARRLSRRCIQNYFGLSRTIPILPRLIRLDLNGTMIDKLILNNYEKLSLVDVSGCPYLESIDIRDCWRLESLSVLGKHAPLQSVSMILPINCKVGGKRDSWHWQTQESHQAISYP